MDFDVQHTFDAPIDRVLTAMVDPAFYTTFTIPDIGPFSTTGPETDGDDLTLGVRYEYVGSLDPMVKRLAGGTIVLLQDVTVNATTSSGLLNVQPEQHHELLQCTGTFAFAESNGATSRHLTGSLSVHVPILGGKAERSLLPGILDRLETEASALNRYLK